ncbi:SRPBCC family protein [Chitinophaga sp. 22308]|uniref:SRPBCC family protein n=1 Tax=unclassified Chitinophaga TaxID=2619133 RepID=UPI003F878346
MLQTYENGGKLHFSFDHLQGWASMAYLYPMASIFLLQRTQFIPAPLPQVWDFFSNPNGLAQITPSNIRFRVTSPPDERKVYPGQVITYTISPLAGIPLEWMTEITHVREGDYFVDEQRVGPYKLWHHQHHFREVPGGVEMTDTVHYRLPLGWLGRLAHTLFVRRQLEHIFAYRHRAVQELFG